MKNDEKRREHTCTSKRAFKTKEYAGMFLKNVLNRAGEMDVYRCGFCGEYHLGHSPGVRRVDRIN
jgi:rubrerythrin